MKTLMALVLLMLLFAGPAAAQGGEVPILSWSRLSLAAGANRLWVSADEEILPNQSEDSRWEVGLYSAYNLTPHLSLAHSTVRWADEDVWETRVGVRLRLRLGASQ